MRLNDDDLAALNQRFEFEHPVEVLKWVNSKFPTGSVGLATGFGAEGAVLIDMLVSVNRRIPIFYLDTDVLFPETYRLRDELEDRYGIKFRRYATHVTLDEQAKLHGSELWETDPDMCCNIRKVQPLREALKHYEGWITAIRREQSQSRAHARIVDWDSKFCLVKINPLAAWTKRDVWKYLTDHEVPYNALYDSGYASIGCFHCTSPISAGEDERSGRWRGFKKKECGLHTDDSPIVSINGRTNRIG